MDTQAKLSAARKWGTGHLANDSAQSEIPRFEIEALATRSATCDLRFRHLKIEGTMMIIATAADKNTKTARFQETLAKPSLDPKTEILRRQNSTLEFDMIFVSPFGETYETLYRVGGRK